jgi:hypothetical protein
MRIRLYIKGLRRDAVANARARGLEVMAAGPGPGPGATAIVDVVSNAIAHKQISEWFCAHTEEPFPPGALLWYR